jgi:hypothetical protein
MNDPLLKSGIPKLLASQFPALNSEMINSIAAKWKSDATYREALDDVKKLEEDLGPVGIWRATYGLQEFEQSADGQPLHTFTYLYPLDFDDVYRPLKYVYMNLLTGSRLAKVQTRQIVHYSTMHVEECLKLLCNVRGVKRYEKKSLRPLAKMLGRELGDMLVTVDTLGVYANLAKHEYTVGTAESLFSVEDAFALYLCSRKLGYKILELTGLLPEIASAFETGRLLKPTLFI